MLERLARSWVYGGALAGVLLLVLDPVLVRGWSAAMAATFLTLPIYMLHQLEEHDEDRFRLFVNRMFGAEVLSPLAVWAINVPGVWGVIAASLLLAGFVNAGYGLIAMYLVGVNGVAHLVSALAKRRYNPGLATAVILFLPMASWGLWLVRAGWEFHAVGLGVGLAIHAAIVVYALRQKGLRLREK